MSIDEYLRCTFAMRVWCVFQIKLKPMANIQQTIPLNQPSGNNPQVMNTSAL